MRWLVTSLADFWSVVYHRQEFWTWQKLVSMVGMDWLLHESGTLPGGTAVCGAVWGSSSAFVVMRLGGTGAPPLAAVR